MTTKLGKRLRAAHEAVDRSKQYAPTEAVSLVKQNAKAKFDETIEAAFKLGIDPRKADQLVRGTVTLPDGSGKAVSVAVFATGEKAREAESAGADFVGDDDLIARVAEGWSEFDVAVATPDMMPKLARVGKILRSRMPSPKAGTVTPDVGKAVQEIKGGKVEYRNDKFGNVHLILGKASFGEDALLRNLAAALDELIRAKPSAAKGKYVQSITLSSTMGPGVPVDPNVTAKDLTGEPH